MIRIEPNLKSVQIEVTNLCNYNCVFCPREKLTRQKGTMSFELFKKIIDEIKSYDTRELVLHGVGESLIDENFIEKLKYARKNLPNSILRVNTNAALLNPQKSAG